MNEPRIREITDEEAAEFERNGNAKTSSPEGLYQMSTIFSEFY